MEKLEAVETLFLDKGIYTESELVGTFQKLYEKNIPAPVRAFIERDNERVKSTSSKSKKE